MTIQNQITQNLVGTGGSAIWNFPLAWNSNWGSYADPDPLRTYHFEAGTGGWISASMEVNKVLTPIEQIAAIKRLLSLNMSELARVLKVERPTVYSWMDGSNPQPANLKRITSVYRVAHRWKTIASHPVGNQVRVGSANGPSLLELLSSETLVNYKLDVALRTLLKFGHQYFREGSGQYLRPREIASKLSFESLPEDRAVDSTARTLRRTK